jgi:hypothetical protein
MRSRSLLLLPSLLLACTGESASDARDPYSDETLAQYLRAIPRTLTAAWAWRSGISRQTTASTWRTTRAPIMMGRAEAAS